ncbi:MAG: tetratricopeptide repeat protein [Magnetococcales bacterium]|nr:tetratricopeptide repeat protein [Magnetococcales bacterium]
MELSHLTGWLALAIVVGGALFGLGHQMGRALERERSEEEQRRHESGFYLRGLNFLISDEPDRAIEEFIQVVRLNSETVEIYLSLGNLFRARGEVGRAIRIHENIIARPNLPESFRVGALFSLAEDYRQGGFLDRAVEAYRKVLEVDPHHSKSLSALQSLHEDEGRWDRALRALKRLEKASSFRDPRREAHLRVNMGQEALESVDSDGAVDHYRAAIKVYPGCLEAYRQLGEMQLAEGKVKKAIKTFATLKKTRPSHFFLLVDALREAYDRLEDDVGFEKCMRKACRTPSASSRLLLRWAQYLEQRGRLDEAVDALRQGADKHPGSAEIARTLSGLLSRQDNREEAVDVMTHCLDHWTARQHNFQCSRCGFKSHDIYWKCPQCHRWDTMEPL